MRFLADENFPFPVVEALRSFGCDVLTLSDLGKPGKLSPTLLSSSWPQMTRERCSR